ncbi:MAG: iron ABC transporter permease [Alphaproteobacteria bacterium]|nr:iron ABC transporter permease [Alphaproteobacteria bacterium]MBL7098067.1 iron ABC transporter permease [Alphaproteobacteria bacterium]
MNTRSPVALWGLLAVLLVVVATVSLGVGTAFIPPARALAALFGHGDPIAVAIIGQIRLPRALLALIVGGVLGLSGAALQGYLRNPLAEPSTLGLSNSAALGGVIALYFGFAENSDWALPLFAIATALGATLVLMALVRISDSAVTLILGGIAMGTLAGAAISLALNLSSNPFAALEIAFWLLGSVEDRSMQQVWLVLPFAAVSVVLFLWDRKALDALTLGEETAKSLGFNLRAVQLRLMAAVALGVGACVAVSGSIGFVGLVVPHILRPLAGSRPSRLLIPSALAGAVLLTAADVLVRAVPTTNELKLGVVTAFLGTPFFMHLLFRARRPLGEP